MSQDESLSWCAVIKKEASLFETCWGYCTVGHTRGTSLLRNAPGRGRSVAHLVAITSSATSFLELYSRCKPSNNKHQLCLFPALCKGSTCFLALDKGTTCFPALGTGCTFSAASFPALPKAQLYDDIILLQLRFCSSSDLEKESWEWWEMIEFWQQCLDCGNKYQLCAFRLWE